MRALALAGRPKLAQALSLAEATRPCTLQSMAYAACDRGGGACRVKGADGGGESTRVMPTNPQGVLKSHLLQAANPRYAEAAGRIHRSMK